uniref:Myb/SANT-like domain-containing protein n=1 Tax=Triticum urartu TaxID=4572 RepID=A0A8R7VBG2_TRIUA
MKLSLIQLLKDHDMLGYRTHNAWSKEAWTSITSQLNTKFSMSFNVNQVKQQEQDLKKAYRSVKDLTAESGFGWDKDRMMVNAPASGWAAFAARKNSKDALQWRDKSFPYYDESASGYIGRYAEGRTRRGMEYYASKANNVVNYVDEEPNSYQTPSPTLQGAGEFGFHFPTEGETEDINADAAQHSTTPLQQMKTTPSSTQAPTEKPSKKTKEKRC